MSPSKFLYMDKSHSLYHSKNAFCGNAGPEEMNHLRDLIDVLTDKELRQLVKRVGITFDTSSVLDREDYELVIDEANREIFYREIKNILNKRKK